MPATPVPLPECAKRLNIPTRWLLSETEAGHIPAINAGGRYLYDVEAVGAEMARRAREAPTQRRNLMTPAQLEKWLGLKRGQAMELAELGEIPAVGVATGIVRFDPSEVELAMSRQEINGVLHHLGDAARYAGIAPKTLRELASNGEVPHFTLASSPGRMLFDLTALSRAVMRRSLDRVSERSGAAP